MDSERYKTCDQVQSKHLGSHWPKLIKLASERFISEQACKHAISGRRHFQVGL